MEVHHPDLARLAFDQRYTKERRGREEREEKRREGMKRIRYFSFTDSVSSCSSSE